MIEGNLKCFDPINGHQMRLKEFRPDGLCVYEDVTDASRMICHPHNMTNFPPSRAKIEMRKSFPINTLRAPIRDDAGRIVIHGRIHE